MGTSKPIQKRGEINWEGNWHKVGLNSDLQNMLFLASKLFREHRTVFLRGDGRMWHSLGNSGNGKTRN
jgi:hypothetical protein